MTLGQGVQVNEDSKCCQLWGDCREEFITAEMSDLFEVVIPVYWQSWRN